MGNHCAALGAFLGVAVRMNSTQLLINAASQEDAEAISLVHRAVFEADETIVLSADDYDYGDENLCNMVEYGMNRLGLVWPE